MIPHSILYIYTNDFMNERVLGFLIYAAKCVSGVLIVSTLSWLLNYTEFAWCLISVILVLSPDGKDSVSLAFNRIKANLVGAGVGLLCLLFFTSNMWSISLAVSTALAICYLFKIDSAARSALAAVIIIMIHEAGKHVWDTAFERVIGVLSGCILGLIITFIFHFKFSSNLSKNNDEA